MNFSKNFKKVFLGIILLTLFLAPNIIFARLSFTPGTSNPTPGTSNPSPTPDPISYSIKIPNPLNIDERGGIPALLEKIISKALLPIGGVVVVVMIIYAGFLYVTAQGAPDKISTAHKALLYAAIGGAILLGARVLASAIQSTVNQLGG